MWWATPGRAERLRGNSKIMDRWRGKEGVVSHQMKTKPPPRRLESARFPLSFVALRGGLAPRASRGTARPAEGTDIAGAPWVRPVSVSNQPVLTQKVREAGEGEQSLGSLLQDPFPSSPLSVPTHSEVGLQITNLRLSYEARVRIRNAPQSACATSSPQHNQIPESLGTKGGTAHRGLVAVFCTG